MIQEKIILMHSSNVGLLGMPSVYTVKPAWIEVPSLNHRRVSNHSVAKAKRAARKQRNKRKSK